MNMPKRDQHLTMGQQETCTTCECNLYPKYPTNDIPMWPENPCLTCLFNDRLLKTNNYKQAEELH